MNMQACLAFWPGTLFFNPQSLAGQPRRGTGDRIPRTPCVATLLLARHVFLNPWSLSMTVPGGARDNKLKFLAAFLLIIFFGLTFVGKIIKQFMNR